MIFDPDCFHDLGNLNPRVRDLPLLPLPEYAHGLCLFMCLHDLGLVPVSHYRLLQMLLPLLHLPHHLGISAHSPLREGPRHYVLLHQPEQIGDDPFRVGFKEALAGNQTDTGEDLHAHLSTRYGTYQVDRVLLLLDVVGPDTEDVAAAVHIYVVVHARNVSGECLFVVGLELLLDLDRMLVLVSHLLNDFGLLDLLLVLKSLQVLPLVLLFGEEARKLEFLVRKGGLSPVTEGSSLVVLDPVLDSRLEEASTCLKLFKGLKPRIEPSRL